MICCKIVTNFNNPNGSFELLTQKLGEKGKLLWANNNLYFSASFNITEKDIVKFIKSSGFDGCYIIQYNKDTVFNEGDFINGWITERLIENNYYNFTKENEDKLRKQGKLLDEFNKLLDQRIAQIDEQNKEKQGKEEKK